MPLEFSNSLTLYLPYPYSITLKFCMEVTYDKILTQNPVEVSSLVYDITRLFMFITNKYFYISVAG